MADGEGRKHSFRWRLTVRDEQAMSTGAMHSILREVAPEVQAAFANALDMDEDAVTLELEWHPFTDGAKAPEGGYL